MNITLKTIPIRDLVDGYQDDGEGGVTGYGGRLDIRPPYQREFVYKEKQRNAVIETINSGFPLNTMYWAVREDGRYEVIDGQQRTISAAQYVAGDFSLKGRYFHNLPEDEKHQILNYVLQVYICKGKPSEKLKWFETVNMVGERLTPQELRNAVFAGPWVSDAKRYFSRKGAACPAYAIGSRYVTGRTDRQEYLETAISWIAGASSAKDTDETIRDYMGQHQQDTSAAELWKHFQAVISRVETVFPGYRPAMKGVDWGGLYERLRDEIRESEALEVEVSRLMLDDDVTKKSGIWPYLLTGQERHLSIRVFSVAMKQQAFEKQAGICPRCSEQFEIVAMEADHITPWSEGGRTIAENCQMLCRDCNRRKSSR